MVKSFFDLIGALLKIPFIGFLFWFFVIGGAFALVCWIIGIIHGEDIFESSGPEPAKTEKPKKNDGSIPPEEQEPFTAAETALLFYSLFINDDSDDE